MRECESVFNQTKFVFIIKWYNGYLLFKLFAVITVFVKYVPNVQHIRGSSIWLAGNGIACKHQQHENIPQLAAQQNKTQRSLPRLRSTPQIYSRLFAKQYSINATLLCICTVYDIPMYKHILKLNSLQQIKIDNTDNYDKTMAVWFISFPLQKFNFVLITFDNITSHVHWANSHRHIHMWIYRY